MRNTKGITLVALVITIIVLLILAGVTISFVLQNNGILNRTKQAGEEYIKAGIKEEIELGIADIAFELAAKTPPEQLTKQEIINKLENKMQEPITIDNGLIGEYKGYEYWIDDDYIVHIGNKVESSLNVELEIEKIGTTYVRVKTNASSPKGNIIGYVYIINGMEQEQTIQSSYTIENLEPETEYTIRVRAIDAKGNKKASRSKTIKTEPREYIYYQGNEFSSPFTYYNQTNANISIVRNATNMGFNSSCSSTVNWYRGIYKTIDLSKDDYVRIGIKIDSLNSANILIGIGARVTSSGGIWMGTKYATMGPTSEGTYTMDVSQKKMLCNFFIEARGNNTTNIRFSEVWLEK